MCMYTTYGLYFIHHKHNNCGSGVGDGFTELAKGVTAVSCMEETGLLLSNTLIRIWHVVHRNKQKFRHLLLYITVSIGTYIIGGMFFFPSAR